METHTRFVGALTRREFLKVAGLAGGAVVLGACTPAPVGAPQSAEQSAEAPAGENITISWWSPFTPGEINNAAIGGVVEGFEQEYPSIKVEYEVTGGPPGGGDFMEVLLARIAAGNPPETATIWTPPSQFGARGSLTPVDDFFADAKWGKPESFFTGPLKSCQWRGKTYGLPASAGAGSIYTNEDKFTEKGISTKREDFPKTWDELKALSAEFVVWEGDELKQAGFVPWAESWLKPVWSGLNGGLLFDQEAEKYVIDSEQNVAWLDYWVQWLDEQYQGDVEKLNLYGNWAGVGPETAFNQGLSAMSQGGSWSPTLSDFTFGYEVVKFPVGPSGSTSVTGYWPNWWAIPNGAKSVKEDFLFCEYFCTKGWEIWYRYVLDTPAWKDFPSGVLTKSLVDLVGEEKAQDIHNFFAAYLEDTVLMWNSPIEDFASDTMDTTLDEVLHKTKTPAQALQEAQGICQAKLEETLQS